MNIIKESMNRPFGSVASAFALVLPPVISIAITFGFQRIFGMLVSIVIFPFVYALSLFVTICGITYLTKIFENKNKQSSLENRVGQLERVVGKIALDMELLKRTVEKKLLTPPKNNNGSSLNTPHSAK